MIQVSNLTKRYGVRTAVDDLNFQIKKGEVVGFLGPNGAGKSTTMKVLTGFVPATEGKATVAGFDVFDQAIEAKRNIGYLPENPPLYMEMRVRDYVEFAARLHQVEKKKLASAVDLVLQKTGLVDVQKRLVGNLSKGYKQRVGLAQALVHNPAVLILDEPTIGLDPKQIIDIRTLIRGLGGDHTVILSSHILPEVTAICERVIVINKGKIVAEDTIERLTTRMKKGLIYSLSVKHAEAASLSALRALPGIAAVNEQAGKIIIEIAPGAQEVRDRIVSTAVEKGMGVLEFAAERVSLEDVFLQLITEEKGA